MIYKKEKNNEGDYIDPNGERWMLMSCRRIRTPEGVNIGWTEFPSLEAALEEWGLSYAHAPVQQR